jgi:hypothetical protein
MLGVGLAVLAGQSIEALLSLLSAKLPAGLSDVMNRVAGGQTVSLPKDTNCFARAQSRWPSKAAPHLWASRAP